MVGLFNEINDDIALSLRITPKLDTTLIDTIALEYWR